MVDYRREVVRILASGRRVVVYNGDADYVLNWIGSKAWVTGLNWPHRADWDAAPDEAFIVNGQTAGRVRTSDGMTFVQVYNAGHLVPMDQPAAALEIVREFMRDRSS